MVKILILKDSYGVNMRLDVFLFTHYPQSQSRSAWNPMIANQHVHVDGKPAKPGLSLKAGHVIEIDKNILQNFLLKASQPCVILPKNIPLDVVYEDDHVLVINKPAGLVCHPGAGTENGTLVNALKYRYPQGLPSLGGDVGRAGLVHRLDQGTSGLMVVAKSLKALGHLAQQFASHQHKRVYTALVYGLHLPDTDRIETWQGRDVKNRLRFAIVKPHMGKHAIMDYKVLQRFHIAKVSLVQCQLHTGRTHQIRLQMEHLKSPLLGDTVYKKYQHSKIYGREPLSSGISDRCDCPIVPTRPLLHATCLGFQHPEDLQYREFVQPLPTDFKQMLDWLNTFGGPVYDAHLESKIF